MAGIENKVSHFLAAERERVYIFLLGGSHPSVTGSDRVGTTETNKREKDQDVFVILPSHSELHVDKDLESGCRYI